MLRKKLKNWLNQENIKKIIKKIEPKKNLIKSIKILKKLVGLVRFRFYKQTTEKTEPNRTESKPEKNRAKLEKNWTKPEKLSQNHKNRENRAKPVWTGFGFFIKISI
jgi:hypothetical protein